jgi:hypothetical protein
MPVLESTLTINHRATLQTLKDKLSRLKQADRPNTEDLARVTSVIKTYERLYPAPKINCIDFTPR